MEDNSKKKKLVVIPAYNEQENIGPVVKKIRESDKEIDIVVIDDGSTDRTARNSRLAGARVIRLSSNMGYGVALQCGYKYGFERGYDCLVQLDGDGQHDPDYIPELLKPVMAGDVDIALGSRFLTKTSSDEGRLHEYEAGMARTLGIRTFSFLTTTLLGLRITDPTSGYQALNRRVIGFLIRDFFPCDYPDADVVVMLHRAGFKIKEVPMIMYKRGKGKSMHSGLKPVYYVFKMLLSILMTLLRKKPIPLY
ncbi:MAG: glycosyl transferase family 2 [Desulfuromonadales bacterium C00003107]|jgi:glycosyltransferase involved in cell wall biosynthesis|nr:MAG: glycosyl transferase family 2 [Desulfuromonadales bacterium C00003107]